MLDGCYKQLQDHTSSEDLHIQQAQDFTRYYEQALCNMSCWRDDFQLRLLNQRFEVSISNALEEVQVRMQQQFSSYTDREPLWQVIPGEL